MDDQAGSNYHDELKDCIDFYLKLGFAVIPAIYGQKRPSVEWKNFQTEKPTKEQHQNWFSLNEPQNLAIVCGKASGNLVVLDFDDPEIYHKFWGDRKIEKETLVVETGSGKYHVYLKSSKLIQSFTIPQLRLEVRSVGNIIIAPPSKHPNGRTYCVISKTNTIRVIDSFEDWIWRKAEKLGIKRPVDLFSKESKTGNGEPYTGKDPTCIKRILQGVEEGNRNNATIRLSSYLLHFKQIHVETVTKLASEWNMRNKPPLPEKEISDVIKSAQKMKGSFGCSKNQAWCSRSDCIFFKDRHLEDSDSINESLDSCIKSQSAKLINICNAKTIEHFHDQHKSPFTKVCENNISKIFPIRSQAFKDWLSHIMWTTEGKPPSNEALSGAVNVLSGQALYQGIMHKLCNRVAPIQNGFSIDMADERGRAIFVTDEGWSIVEKPPILFKRFSHQLPIREPVQGGNSWKLLDFLNVEQGDSKSRLLLMCTVISFFIPDIPRPILVLYGTQGSGKSLCFKLLRKLIDPSAVELLTLARNQKELVQQLDHHYINSYDNITRLPTWISDLLCRAATGGGFTKRKLYSDDMDVTYSFLRVIGLNGINVVAQRGDLLDRCILFQMQSISEENRKEEKEILQGFEENLSSILGGILDILVQAIKVFPTIKPRKLFRMADFTRWGCAIAVAFGRTAEEFIEAYKQKVQAQTEEAAYASPLATVLIDWIRTRGDWEGPPSELFTTLKNYAKNILGISTYQKAWPKAPSILTRKLNELAPSLKALGIEVITGIKSGGIRKIRIFTVPSDPSVHDGEKTHGKHDGRVSRVNRVSSSPSLGSPSLEEYIEPASGSLGKLLWEQIPIGEKCELCGNEAVEYKILDTVDHSEFKRCQHCFQKLRSLPWRENVGKI